MSEDSYDERLRRSVSVFHLGRLTEAAKKVEAKLEDLGEAYITDAEITLSADSFVLGRLWWDGESEQFMVDFKDYGNQ